MTLTRFSLTAIALAVLGAPASAAPNSLSFTTTGFGPVTYFEGEVQESTITFTGCGAVFFCDGNIDFELGSGVIEVTHGAGFNIGQHDGTISIFPPQETHSISTTYHFGSESVTLHQQATLRQILPNNFQFSMTESAWETVALENLAFNMRANSTLVNVPQHFGGGISFRTTFELTQIPEPGTLMLLLFGGAIAVVRRNRSVRPATDAK